MDQRSKLFSGGGEMGALMRSMDWSKTGLGPVETWPHSLRTMLGVVLGSRFPMLLWWGPDLLHLYNDAYRPILRDKHPASLGSPAAEVWAEVWDVAGPMARSVQHGGPATWTEDLQLFISSGKMAEETYFTFSYSPVPGDDGQVGGLLNTVQETTIKVQSERQIRMLHDLAARAAHAKSEIEAHRIVAEVLGTNELDLPFMLLYLLRSDGAEANLVAASGWRGYEGPANRESVMVRDDGLAAGWPLAEAVRTAGEVVVDDVPRRFPTLPPGRWDAPVERAVLLPLFQTGQPRPHAVLIAGVSPHRTLEDRYRRFFRATADQIMAVLATAHAYETERNRAEALLESDRTKTAFFNNVSHEFRTPLTLILGPIEDALVGPEKVLRDENLETVHRSALRLLRLVNSLLDFARLEARQSQPAIVATDISHLTTDLASSFRSLVERAGIQFVVDCAPIQEPIYVDPAHWEKVVLNLLSNAFKFTFQGAITVSLGSHEGYMTLCVHDTGTGIAASELPRIFDRFHRVEGAKGRTFEGSGIGLSLVRELVTLHGGSVTASSVEGAGTTFTVTLPVGRAHLPAEWIVEETPAPSGGSGHAHLIEASRWLGSVPAAGGRSSDDPLVIGAAVGQSGVSNQERARVLVADDNADMREYLTRLLSARWHIDVAEDGRNALDMARSHPPDLILSDVMMPKLDGVALLRELRADPKLSQIPVVLLSARGGEEDVLCGLETGADDYLLKPFSARELLARVQTHLDLARLRRQWGSELERANNELEAFSYAVSHDLRAPLRSIDGFTNALSRAYESRLDAQGQHYLNRVRVATHRMAQIIDDLLELSRISRSALTRDTVDVTELAVGVLAELQAREPGRAVTTHVEAGMLAAADIRLLRVLLENLIGNAWKYSSKQPVADIAVGRWGHGSESAFFVRDNGAGFDMAYAKKLFVPFQRLHSDAQFEGTGIGLATVHRIVTRHGGRIWAEAAPECGAAFFFTLGGIA